MDAGGGFLRNIIIGVVGSAVGSTVFGLFGFYAYGWFVTVGTYCRSSLAKDFMAS